LEIHLVNAIENTGSNIMPPAPPAAAAFFETNKSVCIEWLIRIRKFIVFGAHVSGMDAAFTVRHGLSVSQ
jgi:hypothetical protein